MFSVLQIDPETSAIQVNEYAIQKHPDGELLRSIIVGCLESSPQSLVRFLRAEPDKDLQARLAGFMSNILHEIRHYLDVVFTPYGFYRLRTAFEFYNAIPAILGGDSGSRIPVPLVSGADPINRRILGLESYDGTFAKRFSDIALSRAQILVHDNQPLRLSSGAFVRLGGDAMLEALAFSTQFEWLHALLDTPEYRRRHAQFYRPVGTSGFDLKYRWYWKLPYGLSPNPSKSTMRLVYCILFASLFGSFARGAKFFTHHQIEEVSTRHVDQCLPSYRFATLFAHFRHHPPPEIDDGNLLLKLVDDACKNLFGQTLAESIECDIASDRQFIEAYKSNNPNVDEIFPIFAFEDLVNTREALLKEFRAQPGSFICPPEYFKFLAPKLKPPIVWIQSNGGDEREIAARENCRPICTNTIGYGIRDQETGELKEVRESFCYSYWTPIECAGGIASSPHLKSWDRVFALAPLYKGLLYGYKYRSMLEMDIKTALDIRDIQARFAWDPEYREAGDVSNPDEYLEFYDLTEAQCDVCGARVDRESAVLVSALTVRQNEKFTNYFTNEKADYLVIELLQKDWSIWLICKEEARRFGFLREQ